MLVERPDGDEPPPGGGHPLPAVRHVGRMEQTAIHRLADDRAPAIRRAAAEELAIDEPFETGGQPVPLPQQAAGRGVEHRDRRDAGNEQARRRRHHAPAAATRPVVRLEDPQPERHGAIAGDAAAPPPHSVVGLEAQVARPPQPPTLARVCIEVVRHDARRRPHGQRAADHGHLERRLLVEKRQADPDPESLDRQGVG